MEKEVKGFRVRFQLTFRNIDLTLSQASNVVGRYLKAFKLYNVYDFCTNHQGGLEKRYSWEVETNMMSQEDTDNIEELIKAEGFPMGSYRIFEAVYTDGTVELLSKIVKLYENN